MLERALVEAESRLGHRLRRPARVRVYPTVAAFRDQTGEPGWVAASTVDGVVRTQPLRPGFESILLHEFLHLVLRARARTPPPRWFEEGLVLYLADPSATSAGGPLVESDLSQPRSEEAMRRAYAAARAKVKGLVDRHGLAVVAGWLESGVPSVGREKGRE
jgi:hypothetical protein